MRLSVGPVPYHWPRERLLAFYERIAAGPVDIVYLGETLCPKRRTLGTGEWMELAGRLERAGKEVVLSTLSLPEARSDAAALSRLCRNGRFMVEANDLAAVSLLSEGAPFVTGPTVNIYNHRTLRFLAGLGMRRWVAPVELSRDTLAHIQRRRPGGVQTEVFAFGCLPLAISARCFTARHHNLPRDGCQYRCLDDPEGLLLTTDEGVPFLRLNGVQVQSAQPCNLLPEIPDMASLGVDVLRIGPLARHTDRIIELFHAVMRGGTPIPEARHALRDLRPEGTINGYWHGRPGMHGLPVAGAAPLSGP